jgi:hypothetical protein
MRITTGHEVFSSVLNLKVLSILAREPWKLPGKQIEIGTDCDAIF